MSQTECGKTFDGQYMNARIASIFVLFFVSAAGSFSPILAIKYRAWGVPSWMIYIARYFGSGVILATAFIHLLGESNDSFGNPCVSDTFREYSWGSALALLGTFTMFTIEVATQRLMELKTRRDTFRSQRKDPSDVILQKCTTRNKLSNFSALNLGRTVSCRTPDLEACTSHSQTEKKRSDTPVSDSSSLHDEESTTPEAAPAFILRDCAQSEERTAFQNIFHIFLLEFGIIFHSVFIGLSLAVAGEQFSTLFVAVSFHQFFEGLGLGARFATAKWPHKLKHFPWYLSLAYSLTTPIGIAAGLGVRHLYLNNNGISLIIVGIFDGYCSGLLIYSCTIEFMGRDFLMDPEMSERSVGWLVLAYVMFLLGTLFMALVGKWA